MATKKQVDEKDMTVEEARDLMRARLAEGTASGDIVPTDAPISAESQEVMDKITAEILNAETLDEILAGGQTTPVEEILDRTIRIDSFAVRNGDMGPFAVIDCVDKETGEVLTVACGGQLVLAALVSMEARGFLPAEVCFAQAGRAYRLQKPRGTTTLEVQSAS